MPYTQTNLVWVKATPMRVVFDWPTIDGQDVQDPAPTLYLSASSSTPLGERTAITTDNGLTVTVDKIEAHLPYDLADGKFWWRLDLEMADGPQTIAAGRIIQRAA